MLFKLESDWFKSYCDALLSSEPEATQLHIAKALQSIDERLSNPDLSDDERQAMAAATKYLLIIRETELPKAS